MKRAISLFFALLGAFAAAPGLALAASIPDIGKQPVTQFWFRGVTGANEANTAVQFYWERVVNIVFLLLGSLAILFLIRAGIQYITAGSNQDVIKKSRQSIVNIVLAIIIIVAAYAIINILIGISRQGVGAIS